MASTPKRSEDPFAEMIRVGNRAVRAAQARNRELGIPNWYAIGGMLVSDTGEVRFLETSKTPRDEGSTAGERGAGAGRPVDVP